MNLKGKINNLQIVTSDKQEVRDQMRKEFSSLINQITRKELVRSGQLDTRLFLSSRTFDLINPK